MSLNLGKRTTSAGESPAQKEEKDPRINTDLAVLIAGKAGDGVLFTGNVLARLLKQHGWEVATYRDFPSNIRGEPTAYTVRASLVPRSALSDWVNILLAFDCEAILANLDRIVPNNGVVFCDGDAMMRLSPEQAKGKSFHKFSLRAMARERFGSEIFKNMIALGALSYLLDLDHRLLEKIIADMLSERKGEEMLRKNINAAWLGYEKAREITDCRERYPLVRRKDRGRLILSGDEAIAFGALASGCRFFAAYPICPASEIFQWLAHFMPRFSGVVIQTEDEIAALNMALGASYAGARAMTATSGPGASLMMEAYSLAGMAEIPVVIAHVQRLGPATGIPTKTQQGDILQWVFGSHGEFPRIVLAPGTIGECFELTVEAFNLAEKYQCPVVLLTELETGQNYRTTPQFDLDQVRIDRGRLLSQEEILTLKDFKRYEFTPDGISPRGLPSFRNGLHLVESLEHDESGYRNEDDAMRIRMMEKRMRKLASAGKGFPSSLTFGAARPAVGFITLGSTVGAVREAIERLEEKEISSGCLQLRTLWPFPIHEVREFLERSKQVFVVENNFSGELATLIASQVRPLRPIQPILRYGTRSFTPQEVVEPVLKVLG